MTNSKLYSQPILQVVYDNSEISERGKLRYAKEGDAGLDLCYYGSEPLSVAPGEHIDVPSGIRIKMPDGYVGLIRCRSSTFSKRGLFVVHNTIDSGYTGPLFTTIWNPGLKGSDPKIIQPWDRISQLILVPYLTAKIIRVSELPKTQRGETGFGSTD